MDKIIQMVTIKAKDIARMINRSEGYVYVLLKRKGISLKQPEIVKIIELIGSYYRKDSKKSMKKKM